MLYERVKIRIVRIKTQLTQQILVSYKQFNFLTLKNNPLN